MIVQVIGLPCSGKSTLIEQYLQYNKNIDYIDLADFKGKAKYNNCIMQAKKSSRKTILESACGLPINNSIVVLYKQPINQIYSRHKYRGEKLDEDYLSLLTTQMLKANYTVTTKEAFNSTLDLLFY